MKRRLLVLGLVALATPNPVWAQPPLAYGPVIAIDTPSTSTVSTLLYAENRPGQFVSGRVSSSNGPIRLNVFIRRFGDGYYWDSYNSRWIAQSAVVPVTMSQVNATTYTYIAANGPSSFNIEGGRQYRIAVLAVDTTGVTENAVRDVTGVD